MNGQNFFFITVGSAVVLSAILYIVLAIICIIIAIRIARASRNLLNVSNKIGEILDRVKEKVRYSAFIALFSRGLQEVISLVKEKREEKKKGKK